MNILQVLTELGAGGAERVALELSRELLARGHSVSVASLKGEPENNAIVKLFEESGIEVEFLGVEKSEAWRLARLRGILRSERPDIVHAHLMHPNLATRLFKVGGGFGLVNTVHIAERRPGMGLWFKLDSLSFGLCDACTAVSNAAARHHEASLGLSPGTIKVIYNGMDGVNAADGALLESLKRDWGLIGCDRMIGSIGRLDWQKGYDLLLGMLPALSRAIPVGERWGLAIIGEGLERGLLERLASKAPGNVVVRLPGFRADAASLMGMFDVFAMPSRYEGYGLSLVEAMSQGLAVVASLADSLPELCEGYRSAKCVDISLPGWETEFANALVKAAVQGRQEPRIVASVAEMANGYLEVYEGVLAGRA